VRGFVSRGIALLALLGGCQADVSVGRPCATTSECSGTLVCRLGRCRVDCVENRDCPAGQRCLLDATGAGACSLDVDACRTMSDCPSGLACVDAACSNPCTSVTECPADSSCVAGSDHVARCVPGTSDAGPNDAAALDGGSIDGSSVDGSGDAGSRHTIVSLSAGTSHACMVSDLGEIWCWGSAEGGADGTPTTSHSQCMSGSPCVTVPTRAMTHDAAMLPAPLFVQSVNTGYNDGVAIDATGHVVAWGGPTGFADLVRDGIGVPLALADRALDGDGFAYARLVGPPISWVGWGYDDFMQVVVPAMPSVDTTVLPNGRPDMADDVALGGQHACAIRNAGEVWCWGHDEVGEAGVTPPSEVAAPVHVALHAPATELAITGNASCALVGTEVWCWGDNAYVGTRAAASDTATAVQVTLPAGTTILHVYGGACAGTTCAEDSTHAFWCWGGNGGGAIGPTLSTPVLEPVLVPPLAGATELALGSDFLCALVGGVPSCAGQNDSGQLGRGTSSVSEMLGPITMP